MNGKRVILGFTTAALLHLLTGIGFGATALQDGIYTFEFSNSAAVWDVSGTYDLSVGGIDVSITINMDDKGKLTGFGSTSTSMMGVTVHGNFTVTGSAVRSGMLTRVTLNVKLIGTALYQGKTYKFSATENAKTTVDAANHQLTGTATVKGSVAGQSIKDQAQIYLPLEAGVDGTWDSTIQIATDAKGRITGTGTVLVSGGKQYNYGVTGSYAQKKGTAALSFKGTDVSSKATSLKMTVAPSSGNLTLKTMTGRLLGQAVSIK